MISFILSLIIRLLNFIISFVLTLVFSFFPQFDLSQFTDIYSAFFDILGKGLNLLYFMSGNLVFVFGDILILLFTTKHIVLPIVNFTRKVIIK